MPKKKRSFIDKKKSVTFHLVHRSQKDPLVAADDRGMVLAPVDGVEKLSINSSKVQRCGEDEKSANNSTNRGEKNLEERIKYGIYFDDDYDYLQHLKDANEVYTMEKQDDLDEPIEQRYRINKDGTTVDAGKDIRIDGKRGVSKLNLPASLFESQGVELKTGLLNQAAPLPGPHPELDPDIVAALDDDNFNFYDPDNALEDDFVLKANNFVNSRKFSDIMKKADSDSESQQHSNDEEDDDDDDENWATDEEDDEKSSSKNQLSCYEKWSRDRKYFDGGKHLMHDDADYDDKEEETKSRFTNYSLTSSVIRRSSGLKQVDAVFEKLFEQYDDEELGELENDDNEIVGFIDPESERVAQLIEEHQKNLNKDKLTAEELFNNKDFDNNNNYLNEDANSEKSEELTKIFVDDRPKEKWDCESILSTYSTLYNHPTLIVEPTSSRKRQRKKSATTTAIDNTNALLTLDPKTGLPTGIFKAPNLGHSLAKLPAVVTSSSENNNRMDFDDDRFTVTSSRASTIKRSRFETTEERRARKSLIKAERKERRMEKKQNKLAFKTESIRLKQQDCNVKQNLTGIRLV